MPSDLRPLSLGELLDRTFFLYRKHFLLFVGILALPHLVVLAFQLTGVALQPGVGSLTTTSLLWTVATWIVVVGVAAASQGATVIAVSHVHLERPASIKESFTGMKGRVLYLALILIGCWILIGLAFGVPLLIGIGVGGVWIAIFVIPGIVLALMLAMAWALTVPIAVLEDTGFFDSLSRSAELTKGFRGRVFVVYFLFLLLFYAVIMAWEIPILAVLGTAMRSHQQNVTAMMLWTRVALPVCSFLTIGLVGPLMTIGLSLLYYDLRVRKEAFDLQHMMATLDNTPGTAVSAPV
ncbi:MAG: hypothetical protein WAQ52_07500 [Terriglobales bacterium]